MMRMCVYTITALSGLRYPFFMFLRWIVDDVTSGPP